MILCVLESVRGEGIHLCSEERDNMKILEEHEDQYSSVKASYEGTPCECMST